MKERTRLITKSNSYILALCCLLMLCSCAKKELEYFPSDEGVRWVYSLSYETIDDSRNERLIVENMSSGNIDGNEVLLQKTLQGDEMVYSERQPGLFRLGYFTGQGDRRIFISEEQLVLPRPTLLDTNWQGSLRTVALENGGPRGVVIDEQVDVKAVVKSVNDVVMVKAGRFRNCLRIEKKGKKRLPLGKYQYIGETELRVYETSWYAPGVGLVKISRREETDARLLKQGNYELELRSVTGID